MNLQGGGFSQRFSGHKTGYFHALNKHLKREMEKNLKKKLIFKIKRTIKSLEIGALLQCFEIAIFYINRMRSCIFFNN